MWGRGGAIGEKGHHHCKVMHSICDIGSRDCTGPGGSVHQAGGVGPVGGGIGVPIKLHSYYYINIDLGSSSSIACEIVKFKSYPPSPLGREDKIVNKIVKCC